jgi:hypothetical protein
MNRSRQALAVSEVRAPDRSVRASDRDREALVAQLGEHTSAGRLTLPEFEERVSAAYAAQTLADLDQLTRDLPAAPRPRPAEVRRPARGQSQQWWLLLLVGVICVGIWALTSLGSGRPHYFWPMWVVGPWGVSMLFRTGCRVRRY